MELNFTNAEVLSTEYTNLVINLVSEGYTNPEFRITGAGFSNAQISQTAQTSWSSGTNGRYTLTLDKVSTYQEGELVFECEVREVGNENLLTRIIRIPFIKGSATAPRNSSGTVYWNSSRDTRPPRPSADSFDWSLLEFNGGSFDTEPGWRHTAPTISSSGSFWQSQYTVVEDYYGDSNPTFTFSLPENSIDLTGLVSFSDLSTDGSTVINGANIETGTLSLDRLTSGTVSFGNSNFSLDSSVDEYSILRINVLDMLAHGIWVTKTTAAGYDVFRSTQFLPQKAGQVQTAGSFETFIVNNRRTSAQLSTTSYAAQFTTHYENDTHHPLRSVSLSTTTNGIVVLEYSDGGRNNITRRVDIHNRQYSFQATGSSANISTTGTVISGTSDDRLKIKFEEPIDSLEILKSLSAFYYRPNETAKEFGLEDKKEVGLSAQDLEKVLPEAVIEISLQAESDEMYKTIRYERLVPVLVDAVNKLEARIAELEAPD